MSKRADHEGSVFQRKDGRWVAAMRFSDGRRKEVYRKTQAIALRALAKMRRDNEQGIPVSDQRRTVAAFLAEWLERTERTVRPSTFCRYQGLVQVHILPTLGHLRLNQLHPRHLDRLYRSKLDEGLSPSTVAYVHRVIRRAFGQAEKWNYLGRNPVRLVSPPKVEKPDLKVLDAGQARRLLAAAQGHRLAALFVLALDTGMRQGELLGLQWAAVSLDDGLVHVRRSMRWESGDPVLGPPKTKSSERRIPIGPSTVAALRKHRIQQAEERLAVGDGWNDWGLVFCNWIGKPIHPPNLRQRALHPLLRSAGLIQVDSKGLPVLDGDGNSRPLIRFHDLRHSAATIMLGAGINSKVVSERLGHANIRITLDVYAHVLPDMQAAAVDAMEAALWG